MMTTMKVKIRWMSISVTVVYVVACTVNSSYGIASRTSSSSSQVFRHLSDAETGPSARQLTTLDSSEVVQQNGIVSSIRPTAVDTVLSTQPVRVESSLGSRSTHNGSSAMSDVLTQEMDSVTMTITMSAIESVDVSASFQTRLTDHGPEQSASVSWPPVPNSLPEMMTKIRKIDDFKRQQKSINVSNDDSFTVLPRATSGAFSRVTIIAIAVFLSALIILVVSAVVYRRHKNQRCGKVYLSNNCSSAESSTYRSGRFRPEEGTDVGRPVLLPDEIEAVETSRSKSIRVRRAIVLETDFSSPETVEHS